MSKVLATNHPHFYAIRALRFERDSIETQMRTTWYAYRAEQADPRPQQWILEAYAYRLRTFGQQRRQLRSAMRLLVAAQ